MRLKLIEGGKAKGQDRGSTRKRNQGRRPRRWPVRPLRAKWARRPWRKVGVLAVAAFALLWVLESGVWTGSSGAGGCGVVWVTDGDTVKAWCPGSGMVNVRLLGYDTPEVYSPRCISEWIDGTIASGALAWRLVTADETVLVLSGRDRYGRRLGRLNLDGRNVAGLMIEAGHARAYDGGRRAGWCS